MEQVVSTSILLIDTNPEVMKLIRSSNFSTSQLQGRGHFLQVAPGAVVASGYLGGIPRVWSPSICIWEGIELISIIYIYIPKILPFPQNSFSHMTSIWWAWAKWNCSWNLGFQIVIPCEGLVTKKERRGKGALSPRIPGCWKICVCIEIYLYIYIYTLLEHVSIYFSEISSMCCYPLKCEQHSADHDSQTSNWDGDVYRNIPSSWRKKPSKSMQINETVRCCQDQLTPPKCWGKRQTRRTFFFSSYAVHDVCPYQELFAREHLDKIAGSWDSPKHQQKSENFCLGKVFKNLYTTYMAFRNQGQKCLSLWQKRKIFNHGHGSKIRCMFSVWIQIIHSKDPEIKLVAISRVASEPSWSGLGWPAGTDCTSTSAPTQVNIHLV